MAHTRLDARRIQSFGIGKLRATKQPESFKIWYQKYERTLNDIRRIPFIRKDSKNYAELVFPNLSLAG